MNGDAGGHPWYLDEHQGRLPAENGLNEGQAEETL